MPRVPDDHRDPGVSDGRVVAADLRSLRERHRLMLVISGVVIALAGMLVVRDEQKVAFWFLPNVPAPESCFSRSWFGIPCPGCGLTRSFVSLAHFDWAAAWRFHRLGWLLALVTVAQIPYRLWALSHPTGSPLGRQWPHFLSTFLIFALIVNWVFGFLIQASGAA
ncbi:MAG: DUF2752 domain-containing protein [Planctomycetota bacterium]|nr:DUF2752 domain-containing protein [Planctomycetota bacterium]